jgi:hypothetical protein
MAVKFTTKSVFLAFMVAFGVVFCVMLLSGGPLVDGGPIRRQGQSLGNRRDQTSEQAITDSLKTLQMGHEEDDSTTIAALDRPRVKVTAYVEMMCPDCARFVVHDLGTKHFPFDLWDIVNFQFIPWVRFLV